jgi:DNA methylase
MGRNVATLRVAPPMIWDTLEQSPVQARHGARTRVTMPAPSAVVKFPRDLEVRRFMWGENTGHPAMMHAGLLLELARLYVIPGAVVLDPFGGVGTTALAAAVVPCRVVLTELEPHFVDVARRVAHRLTDLEVVNKVAVLASGFAGAVPVAWRPGAIVPKYRADVLSAVSSNVVVHNLDARAIGYEHTGGLVHTIITSPPYMDTFGHPGAAGGAYTRNLISPNLGRVRNRVFFRRGLAQVYKAALEVLAPGGVVVIVTKDVLRGGVRVPLALENILLLQQMGCELRDWWRRECVPSFQANRYRKRYPDAARVDHEDILVFEKCSSGEQTLEGLDGEGS